MYFYCMYWAFQTLTTVGYGDFGAYNGYEIFITIIWMCFGVIFYSMIVGTMTSVITEEILGAQSLSMKLNALKNIQAKINMDQELYDQLNSFLYLNYVELTSRIDEDSLMNTLPLTLKEEVLFH